MEESATKIESILKAFAQDDGTYKRAEVDAALAMREEITPHLIALLERVVADPQGYLASEENFGHIYALELLRHFAEPRAHPVIVQLATLPEDTLEDLLGDIITEGFPAILFRTCGGSLEAIKGLVLNKEAYEFSRVAAMRALTYAVGVGMAPREEMLEFFGGLFTGHEAEPGSYFWNGVANAIYDLYPAEMMDTIRKAYDDELIDPRAINLRDFERKLKGSPEEALAEVRAELQRYSPADLHAYLSHWIESEEEKAPPPPPRPAPARTASKGAERKPNARRKKSPRRKGRRR